MSWSEEQIERFVDGCYSEMEGKQKKLETIFSLGHFENYWYDQIKGIIQFKDGKTVKVEAKFFPIGTFSKKSNSWMWAWANKSILPELSKPSEKLV